MRTNAAILLSVVSSGIAAAQPRAPTPAPEIAAIAKAMAGTMTCTGKAFMPDGSSLALAGTMTTKADLDGFWIRDTFAATMGKGKFAFESFTTLDKTDKQWHRILVDSVGGYLVGTSPGPSDGKVDFTLSGSGPMGAILFRDHLDTTTHQASGERSFDKGKTWLKDYEISCKK